MTRNILDKFKNPSVIIPTILLLIIVGGITYLGIVPYSKIPSFIENEYTTKSTFSRNGGIPKDGIKNWTVDQDYKIVQTKYDYFKPVYSIVAGYEQNRNVVEDYKKIVQVEVVYLERQGLQDWKVIKYLDNQVNGLNYKEVLDLASQHDLTTPFPNKETYKITNYPPLTPQEIESNRKLREESDVIKTVFFASPYYTTQAKLVDEAEIPGLLSKDERLKRANDFLSLQKNTLNSLESGKEYIYPDGSKVPVSEQTKSFLKKSISGVEITIKMISSVSN
jgi:hypothetical protein